MSSGDAGVQKRQERQEMITEMQIIARLKSLLNARDLTESETMLQAYRQYLELCENVSQRIYECEEMLRRRQKLEALAVTRQAPPLFEAASALDFPEKANLMMMVELLFVMAIRQ